MRRRGRLWGLLLLALLLAGPLASLAFSTAGQPWPGFFALFAFRKLALLWRSVVFSLVVCAGTLLLAYTAAYGFYTCRPPVLLFPGLTLSMVFVPPYIHAQSFIFLFDRLLLGTPVNFNGFGAAALSMCFALLPLPSMLLYECMCAIPHPLLEAAKLYRGPRAAFARVFLPLSLKGAIGSAVMVFVLCFSEFTVPSIFGVNTYALDIFAEYSTTHSAAGVFFHALPALLFCLLFALPASRFVRGLLLSPPHAAQGARGGIGGWFTAACLVLAVQVLLPLVNLFAKWGGPAVFANNLASSVPEIVSSLVISALTLLAALPISLLGGWLIAKADRAISAAAVFFTLLPLAVPSGLTGIACVNLLRALRLTNTLAAPALAGALRLAPFGALIAAGFLAGADPNLISAWRIYRKKASGGLWRVLFILVRPAILSASCFIFALALADVGVILLTAPPGMNTLTIKIYNYLHYGASDVVASLCLAMLAVTALVGAPVLRLFSRGAQGKRE